METLKASEGQEDTTMSTLDTTVAVYEDRAEAEADWWSLEANAEAGKLTIADAALVENDGGESVILDRQSHHGWGKGAVVGAVVGVLFPPSILASAAVGAGGGALLASMTRGLGRRHVQELGEVLDSGRSAVIVISSAHDTNAITKVLRGARTTTTVPSASAEDVRSILTDL
jgi:uncharacterized membrane protein